jgi:hypothetical protein
MLAPSPMAMMHREDPARALVDAAHGLALTDSQKSTLSTLDLKLGASKKAIGQSFQTLHMDLANQVRMGTIDTAKLQPDESVVVSALQTHMTQAADVLDQLHAALEAPQRAAAVAAVRAESSGRTEAQAGASNMNDSSRLERLTSELGLDAEQQRQVAAWLSASPAPAGQSPEGHGQRLEAVLTAFGGDSFDAKTTLQSASAPPAAMIRQHIERKTAFLSQLVPILRPDQREKLASEIETHGREGK